MFSSQLLFLFKKSSLITRGVKWDLFLFDLSLTLINFLGTLCPLIGLLATILTLMMTTVFVYRKLAKTDIEASGKD